MVRKDGKSNVILAPGRYDVVGLYGNTGKNVAAVSYLWLIILLTCSCAVLIAWMSLDVLFWVICSSWSPWISKKSVLTRKELYVAIVRVFYRSIFK